MASRAKKLVSFLDSDESNTPMKNLDNESPKTTSVSEDTPLDTLEPPPPPQFSEEYGAYIYRTVKKVQEEQLLIKLLDSIVPLPLPIVLPPPLLSKPPPCSLPQSKSNTQVQPMNDFEWMRQFWKSSKKDPNKKMARDCILWKLPVAKLFAIGCVRSFRHKLLNAHKNRALKNGGFLKHNMEYYPTIFNVNTRQVWALHHPNNMWKQMPHLNFLPYGVNKMLCGCGGLILLHGGIQPYSLRTIEKHSFKPNCDPTSIKPNHWISKYPPQPMLVLVNPIVQSYLVLPPLEMVLIHVLARITVSALSDSYTIHLVGWEKTHNHTMGVLKVGVYNSIGKEWHFHLDLASNNPLTKSFQPDFVFALSLTSLCRMLPMVYCSDGPVIFVEGKIEAVGDEFNEGKNLVPAIMRYIFQTRSWESDYWPLAETMEAPQIVECEAIVYFVSRTLASPRTLHIYKLVDYDLNQTKFFKGYMDLIKVSTMNHDMYSKCFLDFNSVDITTQYCCVGGMECIWIMCHTLPVMVYYNVKRHYWEYIPSIPMFEPGKTFIGNWMYQPSIHAQVL